VWLFFLCVFFGYCWTTVEPALYNNLHLQVFLDQQRMAEFFFFFIFVHDVYFFSSSGGNGGRRALVITFVIIHPEQATGSHRAREADQT
jgi:hypothetical protein